MMRADHPLIGEAIRVYLRDSLDQAKRLVTAVAADMPDPSTSAASAPSSMATMASASRTVALSGRP